MPGTKKKAPPQKDRGPAKKKRPAPPKKECDHCHELRLESNFKSRRFCRKCTGQLRDEQKRELDDLWDQFSPRQCMICKQNKGKADYNWGVWSREWLEPWDPDDIEDIKKDLPVSVANKEQTCVQCQRLEEWNCCWRWGLDSQRRERRGFYDFPDNQFFSGLPENFSFKEDDPGDEILLGKFQVLYHHGEDMHGPGESQTVQNSYMTLEKNQEGGLLLKATLDKTEDSRCFVFNSNFEMTSSSDWDMKNADPSRNTDPEGWETILGHLKVADQDRTRWTDSQLEEIEANAQGKIMVVKDRIAMPWTPLEIIERFDEDGNRTSWRELLDEYLPRAFTTLEEADKLVQDYETGFVEKDWMRQHLHLSSKVAKTVRDFARFKPCPVLFVHPGDLILHINWGNELWVDPVDRYGYLYSKYILRKVDG